MDILKGDGAKVIVGCKPGETLSIVLISGKAEKVILSDITRHGIEGFQVDLLHQPLTFYPYASILKVQKFTVINN